MAGILWWPEGSACVDGSPTRIYEVLLFFMWIGQPSKDSALCDERLATEEISEGWREECATPSTGRMAQNPATATKHQTRSDEKLCKSQGPDWIGVLKYLAEIFPQLSKAKIKEGVLRSASSSETICSTTYFWVTRKKLGTHFVRCQLTYIRATRNWLRTCCHCITNLVAICA